MQLNHTLYAKKETKQSDLELQCTAEKVEMRGFLFLCFYDLQIWNVSPPSCPRLDHAQLVSKAFDHSCPDRTYSIQPVWPKKPNTTSFSFTVELLSKGKGDNMLHTLHVNKESDRTFQFPL